eukprot:GHVP01013611.1.p2 GENE.GHVP01013611.1~~GHVP01013611.1.p2  ORF type:complete len:151 (-),score=6.82 GHVP01013611.1:97-549(-)
MIMNPITIHSLKTAVLTGIPRVARIIQAEVLQLDNQEATGREEAFLTGITRLARIMIVNPITIAAGIVSPITIAAGIITVNPISIISNTTQPHQAAMRRKIAQESTGMIQAEILQKTRIAGITRTNLRKALTVLMRKVDTGAIRYEPTKP